MSRADTSFSSDACSTSPLIYLFILQKKKKKLKNVKFFFFFFFLVGLLGRFTRDVIDSESGFY